jgi:hypothetical protein
MKKIFTLFSILSIIGTQMVFAQSNSSSENRPTYHELKASGQLGNYTDEEITEMIREEARLGIESPDPDPQPSVRSNDPPLPSMQITSPAFSISPINPSICSGQTSTLTASSSYSFSNPPGITTQDDYWSGIANIGFTFTFYGNNYTQLIIGTNGALGFNTTYASNYHTWPVSVPWPSTTPGDMRNSIAVPWHDLYIASSGTLKYTTIGNAPYRIFMVEYCNVGYYGCWSSVLFTGQVLLYETTNIIETHIVNKPICFSWNGGRAIHGAQNSTGSTAAVVSGRNATQWSTTNEGQRWTWNSSSLNYDITSIPFQATGFMNPSTINWYNSSNTLIGTGSTYTTPSSLTAGTYVYHATCSLSWCGGTIAYTAYDTLTVTNALTAPTAAGDTICIGQSATLNGSCGGNCLWYTQSSGGTPVGTGSWTTPTLSSTTTYYVGFSSGACTSPRTAVTVVIGPTLPAPVATTSSVCDASISTTLSADCGSSCMWYTQSTGGSPVGGGSPFTTQPPTVNYWVQDIDANGCTSPRTAVTVNVGNLQVNTNDIPDCPTGVQNLTATETGQALVNVTVQDSDGSGGAGAPDNGISCTQPDDPGCAGNYITATVVSPANVPNPMLNSSIQSVSFTLYDYTLSGAVGADAQVWLQSPAGSWLQLMNNRPFNSDFAQNTCFCPTFTYSGSSGVIPLLDGPYNACCYMPESGLLEFSGEDPYAGGGIWTLYLVDPDNWIGGSFGFLEITNFTIVFGTYPPSTYSWTTSGTCGTLSNSSISNPSYTPPSVSGNYNCSAVVTVVNGSCSGTATVNLDCLSFLPVEILSYTGKNTVNGNLVSWTTASEINNKYFIISRSLNGRDFTPLERVDSKALNGNSTSAINYSILDKDIKPGVYYYRLSQTDIDGSSAEHGTIVVNLKAGREALSIVPNPTATIAEVTYDCNADETAILKVFDHAGNLVIAREISCTEGENKYILDMNEKTDGIYLVTISTGTNVHKARLIKTQ